MRALVFVSFLCERQGDFVCEFACEDNGIQWTLKRRKRRHKYIYIQMQTTLTPTISTNDALKTISF